MNEKRQYILKQLALFKRKQYRLAFFKDKQDLFNLIENETSFLDSSATLSERLYCIRNDITERKICPVCHVKPLKFSVSKQAYYESGCCPSCSKRNKSVQLKIQETNLKKYGFKSHNSSPNVKQKKVNNFIKKYGVSNPSYLSEVKEKRKKTSLEHFGVESALKLKSNRDKRHKLQLINSYKNYICKNTYDVPMFSLDEYVLRENEHEFLKFKCRKCGNIFETWHHDGYHSRCPICYPNSISSMEKELQSFVSQFVNIITNTKDIIFPLELDIYLPEKKLAIEFDGLYWHSDQHKDKNYHLRKTEMCNKKEIQLIHIFENEWLEKQDIVKNEIKCILSVYDNIISSEKCEIKIIDKIVSEQFQAQNSIKITNSKINIGLYFNDELVSLMSFQKKHKWELLNFCNKVGYNVVGAANKLLKYFEKIYYPKSIISSVDRRWSEGKLQKELGFKLVKTLKPSYLTVSASRKIYDCGKFVFEKLY